MKRCRSAFSGTVRWTLLALMLGMSALAFPALAGERSPLERGMVTLSFDDGLAGVYRHALPILRQRNQTGVTGIIYTKLDAANNDYMTVGQIAELQANGWEIASHGYTHKRPTDIPKYYADERLDGFKSESRLEHAFQTSYEYAQIACLLDGGQPLAEAGSLDDLCRAKSGFFFDREIEELHVKPLAPKAKGSDLDIRACSYERELDQSQKALTALGFKVESYITPYNFWNREMQELARRYYRQVATGWGAPNALETFNRLYISRNVIHQQDTVASVTRMLREQAVDKHEWVVLCFHDIGESVGWEPWAAERLDKLSEWLAANGLTTVTLAQGAKILEDARKAAGRGPAQ
jgi:peptidoglycan/xylan/chitin deacetylase (PgdA/CDA1 family)